MTTLTKQGVRNLDALPGRSRGRRPTGDAVALAHGRRPHCAHRFEEVEQYDDEGMFVVGHVNVCSVCGWRQ